MIWHLGLHLRRDVGPSLWSPGRMCEGQVRGLYMPGVVAGRGHPLRRR